MALPPFFLYGSPSLKKLDLKSLNPAQREAVKHGDGPLLILAGAGSGKTKTMTYRIAHLASERGIPLSEILGLSFTNKAANELKSRVKELVTGVSGKRIKPQDLWIHTFHGLCVKILRKFSGRLGYSSQFSILGESDQYDLIRSTLKNLRIDDKKVDPQWVRSAISLRKNEFNPRKNGEETEMEEILGLIHLRYQENLVARNAMDFDDLLGLSVQLVEKHPDVRDALKERFQHILVDEYQDTNPMQFKLLQALTGPKENLCVVGDDDQSIYAWRGASSEHILEFPKYYPNAKIVKLEQNYRSTKKILDCAHGVISQNSKRFAKKLWSTRGEGEAVVLVISEGELEEAEFVGQEIDNRMKDGLAKSFSEFAILYRSNAQSRIFEEELRRRLIPYKLIGGQSFLDRKEVKDVLSYWKIVMDPTDDASARRAILWPPRKIGKTTLEAINKASIESGETFLQTLRNKSVLPERATSGIESFLNLIDGLSADLNARRCDAKSLSEWAHLSLSKIGVRSALIAEYEDPIAAERRFESVEELAHSAALLRISKDEETEVPRTAASLLREHLNTLVLDDQEERKDQKEAEAISEVTMMTLHSSKGLEFPCVFLVGMEDGYLPHQRSIESTQDLGEETRLCYVGMTRAKDVLYLTRAKTRMRYGKKVPRNPSRFLNAVPAHLLETRNPEPPSQEKKEAHEERVKSFLSQIRARIDPSLN